MLYAQLDAAYQRLDLGPAEVILNVKAGDNPRLAWTDEGDEHFANGGHSGVAEEEGSHSLFISRPERLGGAIIAIPLGRGGQRPDADQVVVACHQSETGADQQQRDEYRGHPLGTD